MSEFTEDEVQVSAARTARKEAQNSLSAARDSVYEALEATRGRSGLSAEEKVAKLTEARDAANAAVDALREAVAGLERAVEVSV